jgi:adenosylmethionine---8-amino-7-oxononanoate aminotransferase
VADKETNGRFPAEAQVGVRVCREARSFGLLIRPLGDVLVVMPPLTIRVEELGEMLDVMERCIDVVTSADRS